jgi:hypothetical protein
MAESEGGTMPLLFALVGVVALALSFMVLVGPVLLVLAVVRTVRTARGAKAPQSSVYAALPVSPVDGQLADAAFANLISREWPSESTALRNPLL